MRTFVIAEAGSCHDGRFDKALRLIEVAKTAGADACKFQWVSNPERLCARRAAPAYLDAYRLLAFPPEWHAELAATCAAAGLEYMCTVYLPDDLAVVAPHVQRFKIASFEAGDLDFFIAHMAYSPKPILISTGMTGDGLDQLISRIALKRRRTPSVEVKYLHCVSAYPASPSEMNLAAIRAYHLHGLSDHTGHPWIGALAVAAGAEIVEVHFRLDDTDPQNLDAGPHAHSPAGLTDYVAHLRFSARVVGDGVRVALLSEEPMRRYRVLA